MPRARSHPPRKPVKGFTVPESRTREPTSLPETGGTGMSDNIKEVLVAYAPHAPKIILALLVPPLFAALVWQLGWPGGALVTAALRMARVL